MCSSDLGFVDGKLVVNPTTEQREKSTLDLVVAATADAVMMVEAGAKRVSEGTILEAIGLAHEQIRILCQMQEELRAEVGKPKREFVPTETPTDLKVAVDAALSGRLLAVLGATAAGLGGAPRLQIGTRILDGTVALPALRAAIDSTLAGK